MATHLVLKASPYAPICSTGRPVNRFRNMTLVSFKQLPKAERCQRCEKLARKWWPETEWSEEKEG